jgi:GTPase SAR1 family protein
MAELSRSKSGVQQKINKTERCQTRNDKQKRLFKIIVVGDSDVGKTCLTYRFCEGKFLDKSEATIGVDFRERTVNVNGEDIKVSRQQCIVLKIADYAIGSVPDSLFQSHRIALSSHD